MIEVLTEEDKIRISKVFSKEWPNEIITFLDLGTPLELPKALKSSNNLPTVDGLVVYPKEPHAKCGECLRGKYWFVDDVNEAISLLNYWSDAGCWAAFDLETSAGYRTEIIEGHEFRYYLDPTQKHSPFGSDPFTSVIYLISVSVNPGEAVVFDARKLNQSPEFKEAVVRFITTCKLIVHNSSFEGPFLKVQYLKDSDKFANIQIDTQSLSEIGYAGLYERHNFDVVTQRTLGYNLDKGWQSRFLDIHPTLSHIPDEAIAYAGGDTCNHIAMAFKLYERLIETEQRQVWEELEQPLIEPFTAGTVRGVRMDVPRLEKLKEKAQSRVKECFDKCVALTGVENPASPAQLLAWLQSKIPANEKTGKPSIDNTQEDTLQDLVKNYTKYENGVEIKEVCETLFTLRELNKVLGTYIIPFLYRYINPVTGKIHPFINQCRASTGRMSIINPPIQTIYASGEWAEIRECFIVDEDEIMVISDYSQFEVRAMAELANEPRMINIFKEAYDTKQKIKEYCATNNIKDDDLVDVRKNAVDDINNGLLDSDKAKKWLWITHNHPEIVPHVEKIAYSDFHSSVGSIILNKDVSKVSKEERADSKAITFAIQFAGNEYTISTKTGKTKEESKQMLDDYFQKFPNVEKFIERGKISTITNMWSTTPFGRKRFYHLENKATRLKNLQAMYNAEDKNEWNKFAAKWAYKEDQRNPQFLANKLYNKDKEAIEREGVNQPCQGVSADSTKLAVLKSYRRYKEEGLNAASLLYIHDEIATVCSKSEVDKVKEIQEECMIKAAEEFLTKVPIEVSTQLAEHWGK